MAGKKPESTPAPKGAEPAGKNELSDADRQSLFLHHLRHWKIADAAKKEAAANTKEVVALAKEEVGKHAVEMFKAAIALETEAGEADIKARIEREYQVARWMAVPLGEQGDMFVDRTPATDRAKAEGVRDGKLGLPRKPSYTKGSPQFHAYYDGYDEGQRSIMDFGRKRDALAFDKPATGFASGDDDAGEGDESGTVQ